MKIAIEARALNAPSAGVKTYVRELIKNLRNIGGADYEVFSENPSDFKMAWWLNVTLLRQMKKLRPDVVHFTKAAIPRRKIAPTVVTIYDIIPILFPGSQRWSRRLFWPGVLKHAALKSDHIITISEASKRGIVTRFGVRADKVTVTPLAVDLEHFKPVENFMSVDQPYILCVGTRDIRKNVSLLIRAFARIEHDAPHRLVIAGRQAQKRDGAQAQARQLGLDAKIKWIDYVNYRDLPALYSGADLFIWPSAYEGWGLPPQEAMACGTPVIVSDGGSLPEVIGQAGEVVNFSLDKVKERINDDEFEKELADRMLMVLEDRSKQEQMRMAGSERAKEFSWGKVARKTFEVYQNLL